MTPDLLREAGEALYGPLWQSALARDMKVADRTVRRWAAGEFGIPALLASDLRNLIRSRQTRLAGTLERLKRLK